MTQYVPGHPDRGQGAPPEFNKDFAPYISKVAAAGADYVITGNWGGDMTQLVVQRQTRD